MNELTEAQLVNHNLIEAFIPFGLSEQISPYGKYYFIKTGGRDTLFNAIFLPEISDPNTIEDLNQQFRKDNLPFCWWIDISKVAPEILQYFEQTPGYGPLYKGAGMYLDLDKHEEQRFHLDTKIKIRIINGQKELEEWVRTLAPSFEFTEDAQNLYLRSLPPLITKDEFIPIGAYYEDKLVGTASIFIKDGVAGFYDDTTMEAYRHHGICTALYHFRIQLLRQLGLQQAVVQTSPMATSLAKKVGFQQVVDYRVYDWIGS
jgi:hypothetical protein